MTETFLERALIWERARADLDAATAAEAAARDALIAQDFADRVTGTNTKALPDSYAGQVMKCVVDLDHKTDAARAKACAAKLAAADGQNGALLAERLFKWVPVVAVGELKKLPDKLRRIADKAIDVKTRRPTIRIETPAPPA